MTGDPRKAPTRSLGAKAVAPEELLPLVYDELRGLARGYLRGERSGHTLQATALVHEAYLRLVDQHRVSWQGRSHFFAMGAQMMRRLLVDHARGKRRFKRGAGRRRVTLAGLDALRPGPLSPEQLLDLDRAIAELGAHDAREAKVVEMRFFAGLSMEEIADHLGVSKRTVEGDWTHARAWLRRELAGGA